MCVVTLDQGTESGNTHTHAKLISRARFEIRITVRDLVLPGVATPGNAIIIMGPPTVLGCAKSGGSSHTSNTTTRDVVPIASLGLEKQPARVHQSSVHVPAQWVCNLITIYFNVSLLHNRGKSLNVRI